MLSKDLPKSPVTDKNNVKLVDTFEVADIVRLYRQQEEIDVAKYFQHGETVYLFECEDVGYRFYYPFEIAGDEEFYQLLQGEVIKKGGEYDRDWADDHKFAFEQIAPNSKVLEIGCNTGKFLERLLPKTQNLLGLEFNEKAAELALKKGLNVKNESIEVHAEVHAGQYDVVCAFQVLEHVTQIKPFLEAAIKLLKPQGKLILSVPNNEPFFQRFDRYCVLNLPPHHVGLWNFESFKNLCNVFEITVDKYYFSATSSFLIDAFWRAKYFARIKTLPKQQTTFENLKIFAVAPFAVIGSFWDYLSGKTNHAHLTMVFSKK